MADPPVQCSFCNAQLQETDIQSETPCHLLFHTGCFVALMRNTQWNHIDECQLCQELFREEEFEDENDDDENDYNVPNENEVTPRQRIQNLFEMNEDFRKKAKEVAKQRRLISKACSNVNRVNHTKKAEIRTQLLLLKAQLQGLVETKMGEVQESTEYKEFLKTKRRYTCLLNTLYRQYNCTEGNLRHYLNDKPGFRRFSGLRHWRHSRYFLLNRVWRYRVPI